MKFFLAVCYLIDLVKIIINVLCYLSPLGRSRPSGPSQRKLLISSGSGTSPLQVRTILAPTGRIKLPPSGRITKRASWAPATAITTEKKQKTKKHFINKNEISVNWFIFSDNSFFNLSILFPFISFVYYYYSYNRFRQLATSFSHSFIER